MSTEEDLARHQLALYSNGCLTPLPEFSAEFRGPLAFDGDSKASSHRLTNMSRADLISLALGYVHDGRSGGQESLDVVSKLLDLSIASVPSKLYENADISLISPVLECFLAWHACLTSLELLNPAARRMRQSGQLANASKDAKIDLILRKLKSLSEKSVNLLKSTLDLIQTGMDTFHNMKQESQRVIMLSFLGKTRMIVKSQDVTEDEAKVNRVAIALKSIRVLRQLELDEFVSLDSQQATAVDGQKGGSSGGATDSWGLLLEDVKKSADRKSLSPDKFHAAATNAVGKCKEALFVLQHLTTTTSLTFINSERSSTAASLGRFSTLLAFVASHKSICQDIHGMDTLQQACLVLLSQPVMSPLCLLAVLNSVFANHTIKNRSASLPEPGLIDVVAEWYLYRKAMQQEGLQMQSNLPFPAEMLEIFVAWQEWKAESRDAEIEIKDSSAVEFFKFSTMFPEQLTKKVDKYIKDAFGDDKYGDLRTFQLLWLTKSQIPVGYFSSTDFNGSASRKYNCTFRVPEERVIETALNAHSFMKYLVIPPYLQYDFQIRGRGRPNYSRLEMNVLEIAENIFKEQVLDHKNGGILPGFLVSIPIMQHLRSSIEHSRSSKDTSCYQKVSHWRLSSFPGELSRSLTDRSSDHDFSEEYYLDLLYKYLESRTNNNFPPIDQLAHFLDDFML